MEEGQESGLLAYKWLARVELPFKCESALRVFETQESLPGGQGDELDVEFWFHGRRLVSKIEFYQ